MSIELNLLGPLAVIVTVLVAAVLIQRSRRPPKPDVDTLVRELSDRHFAITLLKKANAGREWRPLMEEEHPPARHRRSATTAAPETDLLMRIGEAFSPAAPITRSEMLKGRRREIEALVDAAFERGRQSIVYGKRGVGKTSLAAVATEILGTGGHRLVGKVTCDTTDTFDALWRKAVDELHLVQDLSRDRFPGEGASAAVRELAGLREARPADVLKVLRMITDDTPCVVFIDEFDRLQGTVREANAEVLLALSRQQLPVTTVVLGVADVPTELIPDMGIEHARFMTVQLSPLDLEELTELLQEALDTVGMSTDEAAGDAIVCLSGGLPHFTHLIGQMSARLALDEGRRRIGIADVMSAIRRSVEQTRDPMSALYQRATSSSHTSTYADVLLASALAQRDADGLFAAADITRPLSLVTGKNYTIPSFSRHLHALAEPERGPALLRTGYEHRHRFRFVEPALRPFTLMRGLADGMITPEQLRDASRGLLPIERPALDRVSRSS